MSEPKMDMVPADHSRTKSRSRQIDEGEESTSADSTASRWTGAGPREIYGSAAEVTTQAARGTRR